MRRVAVWYILHRTYKSCKITYQHKIVFVGEMYFYSSTWLEIISIMKIENFFNQVQPQMNEPLELHMLGLQLCRARLFTSPGSEHRLTQQDRLRESLDPAAHHSAHPYLISIHTHSHPSFRSSLRFCC